jgi:hypothetical protein
MNRNQKPLPNIVEAMDDPLLFGPWFAKRWFKSDSWGSWRVFLKALYGLPMTSAEVEIYQRHTGRTIAPTEPFTKAWLVCGRRSGKSRVASLIGSYNSAFKKYPELQRGEIGVMSVIASDRAQAGVIFRYCQSFFHDIPLLAKMVVDETKDSLELSNGIRVEVHTSDYRSVRGYSMIGSICDELAFWPSDEHSVSPDTEILNALEKGSANIPGALLLGVSSPYAQQGALWEAHQNNYAKDTDELVWQADTRSMNPTISQKLIDKAYQKDEAAASAEYGAQFRQDLANFLTYEAIAACVAAGRFELPPVAGQTYYGFVDTSGAVGDAMTLAIAHAECNIAVLDMLREIHPPFSPEAAVKEFTADLKRYRCWSVTGDRYAGEWPRERFSVNGVQYSVSEKNRSEIYLDFLPMLNSRAVRLLDVPRLKAQLAGLVRRTRSGGKDSVDHKPGQHDDLCNVAAGALDLVARGAGIYGLLDYNAKIARGEATEKPFGAPGAPPRARIVRGEEVIETHLRSDGAILTRSTMLPPEVAAPPCPACKWVHTTRLTPEPYATFRCENCAHQWGNPNVMTPFDRSDFSAIRAAGGTISGPGAGPRGPREDGRPYRYNRFG